MMHGLLNAIHDTDHVPATSSRLYSLRLPSVSSVSLLLTATFLPRSAAPKKPAARSLPAETIASPAATMRWVGSRVSVGWSKLCHRTFPLPSSMARLPESCSRARAAVALALTVEFQTTSPS
uniref:Uncharacterized protein n=1 Tax=Oryza nivara TaxID=4536 RepID=A0A0E0J699_ORYNI